MELNKKPNQEQAELIKEMYEYIMELMQLDLKVMVKLDINNCLISFACHSFNGEKMHFSKWFFFSSPIEKWQNQFQEVKEQIIAIVNEVDISEIADKNQNHGC